MDHNMTHEDHEKPSDPHTGHHITDDHGGHDRRAGHSVAKEFRVGDARVAAIAEMVHDADLNDGKFGRKEAFGVDEVLNGWARKGTSDNELLERGMEMIEGLYHSA